MSFNVLLNSEKNYIMTYLYKLSLQDIQGRTITYYSLFPSLLLNYAHMRILQFFIPQYKIIQIFALCHIFFIH